MIIDFTYQTNEKEERILKLQKECKFQAELIEEYEALRGNPEVTEEELEAAIKEAQDILETAENEIIDLTWNK